MRHRWPCAWLGVLAFVGGLNAGCRDEPPLGPYQANLGSSDAPLLPTRQYTYDATILDGKAKRVERGARPAPREPEPSSEEGEKVPPEAATEGAKLDEADIVGIEVLVDIYNALVEAKKYDELSELHVASQREAAKVMYSGAPQFESAFTELSEALERKSPGGGALLGALKSGAGVSKLAIGPITADGPDGARAPMKDVPMELFIGFERVDGNWLFNVPFLPTSEKAGALREALDGALKEMKTVTAGLNDGSVPPSAAMQRLAPAFQKLGALILPGAPGGGG